MENGNSVIVYRIINKFNRVTSAYFRLESAQNILSANPMPKSRFVELNNNIHKVNVAWKRTKHNEIVKFMVNPGVTGENIKVRSVMKKLALVLSICLCACGQGSSSKTSLFNEALGTVGNRPPSGYIEDGDSY